MSEAENVEELPVTPRAPPPRRHAWDPIPKAMLAATEFPDGNARTLRTCSQCGMIKVTVHSPDGRAWREWRTKSGDVWHGQATPPCLEILDASS